jgi:hypothetical protein
MNSWSRRIAACATAGLLGTGVLFAEPLVRSHQSAEAASWQLYIGSEYNSCEGCCYLSYCCKVGLPCAIIID